MTLTKKLQWVALISILLLGAAVSQAQDARDFRAVNYTGFRIRSVFVSPHESGYWGSDVLGSGTLVNGYQTTITFNPYIHTSCYFDFKVVFQNGAEQTYTQGWDLCAIREVYFYDGYLRAY